MLMISWGACIQIEYPDPFRCTHITYVIIFSMITGAIVFLELIKAAQTEKEKTDLAEQIKDLVSGRI